MTALEESSSAAPTPGPSTGTPGWQPYRYGEPPVVADPAPSRAVPVSIVLGGVSLSLSLVSVLEGMLWASVAIALALAAVAAVVALGGVVTGVLGLGRTAMRVRSGGGQAIAGTSLSSAGFAASLLWTVVLVLTAVAAPVAATGPAPVVSVMPSPATHAAAPVTGAGRKLRFEVTGTVSVARISYQFAGTSGGDTVPVPVPWSKDVSGGVDEESFSINAYSETGQQGSVTCTISDAADGTVLDTKTVETDGSPQSSAYVDCNFYG